MVGCGGANPAPNSTGEPSSEPSEVTRTSLQEGKLENTTPTDGSENIPTTTPTTSPAPSTSTSTTTTMTTTTSTTTTAPPTVIESEEPEDYFITYQPNT